MYSLVFHHDEAEENSTLLRGSICTGKYYHTACDFTSAHRITCVPILTEALEDTLEHS